MRGNRMHLQVVGAEDGFTTLKKKKKKKEKKNK